MLDPFHAFLLLRSLQEQVKPIGVIWRRIAHQAESNTGAGELEHRAAGSLRKESYRLQSNNCLMDERGNHWLLENIFFVWRNEEALRTTTTYFLHLFAILCPHRRPELWIFSNPWSRQVRWDVCQMPFFPSCLQYCPWLLKRRTGTTEDLLYKDLLYVSHCTRQCQPGISSYTRFCMVTVVLRLTAPIKTWEQTV